MSQIKATNFNVRLSKCSDHRYFNFAEAILPSANSKFAKSLAGSCISKLQVLPPPPQATVGHLTKIHAQGQGFD